MLWLGVETRLVSGEMNLRVMLRVRMLEMYVLFMVYKARLGMQERVFCVKDVFSTVTGGWRVEFVRIISALRRVRVRLCQWAFVYVLFGRALVCGDVLDGRPDVQFPV